MGVRNISTTRKRCGSCFWRQKKPMKHDRGKTPVVTAGRLIAWSGGVSAMALAMKDSG